MPTDFCFNLLLINQEIDRTSSDTAEGSNEALKSPALNLHPLDSIIGNL